ncbi:uncharacterized protein LOC110007475 [Amborella trichopoda]|uniref:uncharacterized protein LOC110007475 n=1 Tax=Amborella trichopoda TaxID=13333 RepID=UPI0009BDDD04|nr:uncharacterized protein LOC110007475 [Amborella trichopoda]|eukprot:XP_020524394.1 uncharacterized protein LOC110007475 [Amborella trichopoda]
MTGRQMDLKREGQACFKRMVEIREEMQILRQEFAELEKEMIQRRAMETSLVADLSKLTRTVESEKVVVEEWTQLVAELKELWKERNRRTFEGLALPFENVIHLIKLSIWSSLSVTKEGWGVSKVDVMVNLSNLFSLGVKKCWPKGLRFVPPLGCLKINFDGSSMGNPGPAGIGGVIHDCYGNIVLSFIGPIGLATSNFTEMSALLRGLKIFLKWNLGSTCLIEGDSLNVIRWHRKEQKVPWELLSLWLQIMDASASLSVSFSHVYHEANCVTDALAKGGVALDSLSISDDVISF